MSEDFAVPTGPREEPPLLAACMPWAAGANTAGEAQSAALRALGWRPEFAASFADKGVKGAVPGRVARVDRQALTVLDGAGELRVVVAPTLAHQGDPLQMPTVGDWVVVADATVTAVLERHSALVRAGAGNGDKPQVLAANVDKVFVVASLEGRFRPRRLERLLVLAWQSGAAPVVVLTKADIAGDLSGGLAAAELLVGGGAVHAVSSLSTLGLDELRAHLEPGTTVALIGPSGAGKSTLANALGLGTLELATGPVRGDGKGRHTTTARELVSLPNGAMLIDTPGLRSLGLWEADDAIASAFGEVEELAAECRFSDCAHSSEPGCAIRLAIETGSLEAERYASFEKLRREQHHYTARTDPLARAEERKFHKAIARANRGSPKR